MLRPPARTEGSGQDLEEKRLGGLGLDAALSELERGDEEPLPWKPPASGVRLLEACEQPGHGDGGFPDVEHLRRRVAEVDDDLLHLLRPARRDGEEAVESDRLRSWLPEQDEAAARGALSAAPR